jgi:hypothetical protein
MIAPGASARYTFTPDPAGFRWFHTHTFAGNDLRKAQYGGQHGFLMIEPSDNPPAARYDREVFLALHDWGGAMMPRTTAPMPRLRRLHHQRQDARLRRAGARQAGRAGDDAHPQLQPDRGALGRARGAQLSGRSRSTATPSRSPHGRDAAARAGRTRLRDRRDERARRVGAGRGAQACQAAGMGIVIEYAGANRRAQVDPAGGPGLGLRAVRDPAPRPLRRAAK